MASVRFITFLLVLILQHVNSTALITHQDKGDVVIPAGIAEMVSNKVFGGRRMMMLKRVIRRKEMREEELLNTQSTEISGAEGNCKKGIRNGKCESMSTRMSWHPSKEKMVAFTTFSADYHVPKSHPPKNNR